MEEPYSPTESLTDDYLEEISNDSTSLTDPAFRGVITSLYSRSKSSGKLTKWRYSLALLIENRAVFSHAAYYGLPKYNPFGYQENGNYECQC